MNYELSAEAKISCFQSFNHAICYQRLTTITLTSLVLILICQHFFTRLKMRKFYSKKSLILLLLLIESLCFLLSNIDMSLEYFNKVQQIVQNITLTVILYYYVRAYLKTTDKRHFMKYTIAVPILLLVGITILAITDKQRIVYMQMAMVTVLALFGAIMTAKLCKRVKDVNKLVVVEEPLKKSKIQRFWFMVVVLAARCVVQLNTYQQVWTIALSEIGLFYLPVLAIFFNFKKSQVSLTDVRRTISQEIMLSHGLYFKYDDS